MNTPCVNEQLCKMLKRMTEKAKRMDYGVIEVAVRKGKIIHFDMKEIINTRFPAEQDNRKN